MDHRRAITVLGCLLSAAGAGVCAADPDPDAVLRRVIAKVKAIGGRFPDFTCVEAVTREKFHPAAAVLPRPCSQVLELRQHPTLDMVLQSFSTDRLRLDVTMTSRGELLSWAGARRFKDDALEEIASDGPLATGAFGGFLLAVFKNDSPRFSFVGYLSAEGRRLMEYRFAVGRESSTFRVWTRDPGQKEWVYTAYSGRVQVDPATAEVVRLIVDTAELPPESGSCQSTAALDFEPGQVGPYRIPLPVRMNQRFVAPDGSEAVNTTNFAGCREYIGESTLTFPSESAAPPAVSAAQTPAPVPPLPAGLRLTLALTAPIDTESAAAGDLFAAKLAEPLRDAKDQILAPRNALVEGRLLRVECFRRPPRAIVTMRPDSVEVGGVKIPFAAVIDASRELSERRGIRSLHVEFALPAPTRERSGVFQFLGETVIVPRGFRSDWRTAPAPREGAIGRQ